MAHQWLEQKNPLRAQCECCRKIIQPFETYYRASADPDGIDEFGYDVCSDCKAKLPQHPEPNLKT